MIQDRLHAIGLALAISLAFVPAVGKGEVVFGNLGASGTNALSNTGTDIGERDDPPGTTYRIALGFTTGSSSNFLKLTSISLGLFYDNAETAPFSLSIYENNAGSPAALALTSSITNVGLKGTYSFAFGNAQLSANTTYWIVPSDSLFWYVPSGNTTAQTPDAFGGSGYSWPGTTASVDGGSTWDPAELEIPGGRYSFSISAVPEQGTLPLAGIGLVGAGWAVRRMRRRSSADDVADHAANDAGV